jgi:hypothetical protein
MLVRLLTARWFLVRAASTGSPETQFLKKIEFAEGDSPSLSSSVADVTCQKGRYHILNDWARTISANAVVLSDLRLVLTNDYRDAVFVFD